VTPGCAFHPRCPWVQEKCRTNDPEMLGAGRNHASRCHFTVEQQDALKSS